MEPDDDKTQNYTVLTEGTQVGPEEKRSSLFVSLVLGNI
jgi:hypothetical protein